MHALPWERGAHFRLTCPGDKKSPGGGEKYGVTGKSTSPEVCNRHDPFFRYKQIQPGSVSRLKNRPPVFLYVRAVLSPGGNKPPRGGKPLRARQRDGLNPGFILWIDSCGLHWAQNNHWHERYHHVFAVGLWPRGSKRRTDKRLRIRANLACL